MQLKHINRVFQAKLNCFDDIKLCDAFFQVIEKHLLIDKNEDTIN